MSLTLKVLVDVASSVLDWTVMEARRFWDGKSTLERRSRRPIGLDITGESSGVRHRFARKKLLVTGAQGVDN